MGLRLLVIKFTTPLVWRFFPARKVEAIKKFGLIEKDSANQLTQCMAAIDDPAIRAALFQHVLEELHHHELFDGLAHQFSRTHLTEEVLQRSLLLSERPSKRDIVEAYAYAHVGELEVDKEFRAYARGGLDRDVRAVFAKVAADEGRHVHGTDEVLQRLIEEAGMSSRLLLFRALWKLRIEKLVSVMRTLGGFQLNLVLGGIYFAFGGLLKPAFLRRLSLDSDRQFRIFKEQVDAIGRRAG